MNSTVLMYIFNTETKTNFKSKPQTTGWENIFTKHVTDKGIILKVYLKLFKFRIERQIAQQKTGKMDNDYLKSQRGKKRKESRHTSYTSHTQKKWLRFDHIPLRKNARL